MEKSENSYYTPQPTANANFNFINSFPELFEMAKQSHQQGEYSQAASIYARILDIEANNIEAHLNLGVVKHDMGDLDGAVEAYKEVLKQDEYFVPALFCLGNVLRDQEYPLKAEVAYQDALSLDPANIDVLTNLANLYFTLDRSQSAIQCYNKIIKLEPRNGRAYYNLGLIHQKNGELIKAAGHYELAMEYNNEDGDACFNLGVVLNELGKKEEAVSAYQAAIDIDPYDTEAYFNLGNILKDLQLLDSAESCYHRTLELDPCYVKAITSLGIIHHIQGDIETALVYYQRAIEGGDNTPGNLHIMKALAGEQTDCAPREYVLDLFDNCASRFDHHLQDELGYEVPVKLRYLLDRVLVKNQKFSTTLDLGCGTGLSGVPFRDLSDRLLGVDLSSEMLNTAEKKGVYDHLQQDELVNFLEKGEEIFDLVIVADVFIYLGRLESFFKAASNRTSTGSLMLCSTETCNRPGVTLQHSGRYAHDFHYIKQLAVENGFILKEKQLTDIRLEREVWLRGELLLLERI